jgi:hypothetical protein
MKTNLNLNEHIVSDHVTKLPYVDPFQLIFLVAVLQIVKNFIFGSS